MHRLKIRIHQMWLIAAICYGFIIGVAISPYWQLNYFAAVVSSVIMICLAFWSRRSVVIIFAVIGGLLIGLARGGLELNASLMYQVDDKINGIIYGKILEDIDQINENKVRLKLGDVKVNGRDIPGIVFATVQTSVKLKRSDVIEINGTARSGFGKFILSATGNIHKVYHEKGADIPLEVRDNFADHIRKFIDEPQASLGIGYLLGQKSTLPNDLYEALKITGLTHIVVASGYNLTILVRLGRRLFEKVSKYLSALTAVVLIVGFISMTGLSPSMVRAGLVSFLSLLAWYCGRKFHPVVLLGLTASLTVFVDPTYIWGDLGWSLSFSAFAGVMIIAPIITAYFCEDKPSTLVQILIETVSAQIATLPIMIGVFHNVSVVSPLINLLVLPFIPLIMLLTTITGVFSYILPIVSDFFGSITSFILGLQIKIIHWGAGIDGASIDIDATPIMLAILVLGICAIVGYMKLRSGVKLYDTSIIE